MKKFVLHMALVAVVISQSLCFTACGDDLPTPDEKLSGNTVIVYMGAENSLAPYAQWDLNEMKAALDQIPADCQVVVYKDAELKPVILHLTSGKCVTHHEYKTDHNSGDAGVMRSVLDKIVRDFPSEKYSLVLWSHGTGWYDMPVAGLRSIIVDNGNNTGSNRGQWVHMSQLADVLAGLPHMEFILSDACYMQGVEVASWLYPYADYLIGSPTETPATGAPYDLIMNSMCRADIQGIIDGYASAYSDGSGVLLSAVCSASFPDLCRATAMHVPTVFPRGNMPGMEGVQIYAPAYGRDSYSRQSGMPVPYDLRSAMYHVLDAEAYARWEEQWQKAILYPHGSSAWISVYDSFRYGREHCTMTDPRHYGGISMNIPQEGYEAEGWNMQFRLAPWYTLTLWEGTGW